VIPRRRRLRNRATRSFTLGARLDGVFVYSGAAPGGNQTVENPLATIPDHSCLERNRERRSQERARGSLPGSGHGTVDIERWAAARSGRYLVGPAEWWRGWFAMWVKEEITERVEGKARDHRRQAESRRSEPSESLRSSRPGRDCERNRNGRMRAIPPRRRTSVLGANA